jgi:hypothetical protein
MLVDDIDGTTEASSTVEFGYQGIRYELDLSDENAFKLDAQLQDWIKHARVIGRPAVTRSAISPVPKKPASTDKLQLQAIREWARANGYQVSLKGRIPQDIMDAYNSSN